MSKWKWEGKVPKGLENNTHLVIRCKVVPKLNCQSIRRTNRSFICYKSKDNEEKDRNDLSILMINRAKYVKELHKSIDQESLNLHLK